MPTLLQQILDTVQATGKKVDELVKWQVAMDEKCLAHRGQTDDLKLTVYGNPGNNGLKDKVLKLWCCKKSMSRWRDFWMGVWRLVAAGLIIAVGTWLFLLYKNTRFNEQNKSNEQYKETSRQDSER